MNMMNNNQMNMMNNNQMNMMNNNQMNMNNNPMNMNNNQLNMNNNQMNMNNNQMNNNNNQMFMMNLVMLNCMNNMNKLVETFNKLNTNNNGNSTTRNNINKKNNNKKRILPNSDEKFNVSNIAFPEIPGNRINIIFHTSTGHIFTLIVPEKVSIGLIFREYVQKVNIGPNLINNGIYFLFNGKKFKNQEFNQLPEYFGLTDHSTILVVDTKNSRTILYSKIFW